MLKTNGGYPESAWFQYRGEEFRVVNFSSWDASSKESIRLKASQRGESLPHCWIEIGTTHSFESICLGLGGKVYGRIGLSEPFDQWGFGDPKLDVFAVSSSFHKFFTQLYRKDQDNFCSLDALAKDFNKKSLERSDIFNEDGTEKRNKDDKTLAFLCAKFGNLNVLEQCLEYPVETGQLHYIAAYQGKLSVLEYLFSRQIPVDGTDILGNSFKDAVESCRYSDIEGILEILKKYRPDLLEFE